MIDSALHILVVDDSSESWSQLRGLLSALNTERIDRADSGTAAVRKLKTTDYNLIFSAPKLPDVNATDLVQVIRYSPRFLKTPFIIVSNEGAKEGILDAIEGGASDYILKPLTLEVLTDRISKALQNKDDSIFVKWEESLSVGVSAIDAQHKGLVALINALHDSILLGRAHERIEWVVSELIHYTKEHFECEENLLEQCNYACLEDHKKVHHKLESQVRELSAKSKQAGTSLEAIQFLKHWITRHIMSMDKQYEKHVKSYSEKHPLEFWKAQRQS